MASAFSVFRKHQRVMMAVACVVAMFLFVFQGRMTRMASNDYGGDLVVATTSFGNIQASELAGWRESHNLANLFASEVMLHAFGPSAAPYIPKTPFGSPTDDVIVNLIILNRRAEQADFSVSDDAVTQYIRERLASGKLTYDQLDEVIEAHQSRAGGSLTKKQVIDALRRELMASNWTSAMTQTLGIPTPGDQWQYYRKLKQRATAEVATLPVEQYLSKVPDPTDAEIAEFYNKYKDAEPVPGSPTPGFKVPEQAVFEYIKIDYQKMLASTNVTDAEVRKYYDDNKAQFKKPASPPVPFGEDPAKSGDKKPTDNKAAPGSTKPAAPADAKSPAEKSGDAKPADAKPDAKPADEKPSREEPSLGKPAAPKEGAKPEAKPEPKADDKQTKPEAGSETAAPSEKAPSKTAPSQDKSAALALDNAIAFAPEAELKTDTAKPDTAKVDDSKPENDKPANASAPKDPKQADEPPATPPAADAGKTKPEDKPAAKKPADSAAKPAPDKTVTDKPAADKPATDKPAADKPAAAPAAGTKPGDAAAKPAEDQFKPFAEVEKQIRDDLVRSKAQDEMERRSRGLMKNLRTFNAAHTQWEIRREEDPTAKEPAPPSIEAMARELGPAATAGKTPLVAAYQLSEIAGFGHSLIGNAPIASQAYKYTVFQTGESRDRETNDVYLFWRTKKVEPYIPKLEEIRTNVVRAWKIHGPAHEAALANAKKLAQVARSSKQPLKEALKDRSEVKVQDTEPFTWLTQGLAGNFTNFNSPPRLSDIKGITDEGDRFMADVFALREGEVGVTENKPGSEVYVVRVEKMEPSREVLQALFMADDSFRRFDLQHDPRLVATSIEWQKFIEKQADLKWTALSKHKAVETPDVESPE